MRITIIIPTIKKTLPYLLNCIESIQRNSKEYHEIILVSNWGEHYEIPHNGSTYIKRFHLEEQGQCNAVNFGVTQMNTKYGVGIDDDMGFPPGWEKILDKIDEKQSIVGQEKEPGIEKN